MLKKQHIIIVLCCLFNCLGIKDVAGQFYYGSQNDFGKNRVQHKKDLFWTYYSYDRYEVYFYEGGKDVANYISKSIEKNLSDLEKNFDFSTDERLQFIVYNKQSEFKQSNIGLVTEEQFNIGGYTRIVGTKISLYFEGDHQKLDEQIRSGIAEILINQMMYGGSIKDMFKNSTLLALPEWFMKGLVSYSTNKWSTDIDNHVRDGILSGRYNKFNRLSGVDALYAGHSIWNYIAETYGEQVISNILYMTRINRNIETAFLFVLGASMRTLSNDYLNYYKLRYDDGDKTKSLPTQTPFIKKVKLTRIYTQVKLSPDGKNTAYVTNELGQYKVWIKNSDKKKPKRIIKAEHKIDRINDLSYPLLAWHPSGKLLSMITEEKGSIWLTLYSLEEKTKDKRTIINFDKILDFSYSNDGKKFVMSAIQKGQSDIFVFTAASNGYEQITKDIYDDFNPRFVHNSKEIIFSSNRTNDTIKFDTEYDFKKTLKPNTDIFVFDYARKSNLLKRLTNTPSISEYQPADYDSIYFSYISDLNGIRNKHIAYFDSVISFVDTSAHYRFAAYSKPLTNYSRNIIEHDVNVKTKKYAEVIFNNGKYNIYTGDLISPTQVNSLELKNTLYREDQLRDERKRNKSNGTQTINQPVINKINTILETPIKQAAKQDSGYIDINNYVFEIDKQYINTKKEEPKKEKSTVINIEQNNTEKGIAKTDTNKKANKEFKLAAQKNYYINFALDYVVSQLDNSFLNPVYQQFTGGGGPVYLNPGLNGLFKISMSDLLEDRKIVGGMRIGLDFSNNEFLLSYDNRTKRLDKQLVLHRQAFENVLLNLQTHDARYSLRYPFSEVMSLRGSLMLRNDRTVILSRNDNTLQAPNVYDTWGGAKMEFIFDNTISKGLNLYNGTRLKVFGEYYRRVDRSSSILPSPVLQLFGDENKSPANDNGTDFFVLGFDVRHYQKIHRDLIWANRIAGSTSFGAQKLVYYMGGVDNWFTPRFDNSINIATNQNYAYQTLATPLRGFIQNVRNGNSFIVINSEIRWPIFRYLFNRPIRSDFINNFQVLGFGDIGTAWTGWDPYSTDNSLNTSVLKKGSLTVTLTTQREPIVAGYGFGLRSRLFGYFVRADWAWGVDEFIVQPRVFYLSFSLDF